MMFLKFFPKFLRVNVVLILLFYLLMSTESKYTFHKFSNHGKNQMETAIRNYAKNMADTKLLKISSNLNSKYQKVQKNKQEIISQESIYAEQITNPNSLQENKTFNSNTQMEISEVLSGSVLISENGELIYSTNYIENEEQDSLNGKKLIARAKYTKSLKEIGWSKLFIETFDNTTPEVQSWAAGLLEGKLCAQEIWDFYRNLVGIHTSELEYLKDVFDFYKNVEKFIRIKTSKKEILVLKEDDLKYWISVAMIQAQTDGMLSGYNSIMKDNQMDLSQFYFVNADGEVPELINVFKYKKKTKKQQYQYSFREQSDGSDSFFNFKKFSKEYLEFYYGTSDPEVVWNKFMLKSHCSAVIKVLKDENDGSVKDILVGHTTWDSFSEMHRIFKIYKFSFTIFGSSKKKSKIMLSSYPGTLTSTDDFYILNNKMVVTETTLEMIDQTIYEKDIPDASGYIPNYIRISVSNRLADSAKEWIEYFKKNNSGTYNSQWMILDFSNLFYNHSDDMQNVYVTNNNLLSEYSYGNDKLYDRDTDNMNLPGYSTDILRGFNFKEKLKNHHKIYKEIFFVLEQIPGYIEVKDMTDSLINIGYWASYNRPFFDDIATKTGYLEMTRLYGKTYSYTDNPRAILINSRIDDVKGIEDMKKLMQNNKDIMSSNFMNTVSPRYDLSTSIDYKRPAGGIDSKIVNLDSVHKGKVNAISGPSHESGAPPFDWKDWPLEPHYGLPQRWNFDWVIFDDNFIKNKN